jgi:hypothetical protein
MGQNTLDTADLFVHSSIVELESLSSLEAIGCGLTCLVSDSKYSAARQFALDERFLFTGGSFYLASKFTTFSRIALSVRTTLICIAQVLFLHNNLITFSENFVRCG